MTASSRQKRSLRVAAAQYPVSRLKTWAAFEAKLSEWFARAADNRADLLVFPEYAAMELASLLPASRRHGVKAHLRGIQSFSENYLRLYRELCAHHRVWALTGSFPLQIAPREHRNRAWLVGPDGEAGHQDKMMMTPWERAEWGMSGSDETRLFDTPIGRIGVCICYDVEFPRMARALAEAGASVILAPSCTDTLAGYHRVRIGAQARALENQCAVAQASLVGRAAWSPAVDVNIGAAGVYCPPDTGLPDDGILARGELNAEGWIFADVNLARMQAVRRHGQVRAFRDWDNQREAPARIVAL